MICCVAQNELAGAALITCLPTLQPMFSHTTKPQSIHYIIKAMLMAIMWYFMGRNQMFLIPKTLKKYYQYGLAATEVWYIPICPRTPGIRYLVRLLYLSQNLLMDPKSDDAEHVKAQASLSSPILSCPDTVTRQ